MSITLVKEIIFDRIRVDVFRGHNALAVYIAIADHSSTLNASPFSQAMGTIQGHALDAFILCMCRLYEKPNQKYPNYSIPTTIALLEDNLSGLSSGIQNYVHFLQFIQTHIDPNFDLYDQDNISDIPTLILNHFSEKCPRTPPRDEKRLDRALDDLKYLRNKYVAHHEREATDLSSPRGIDIDESRSLLAFAQTYVNLVGYGFFGSSAEGEVDADKFDPNKSVIWPELHRMIGVLKQASEHVP